MNGSWNQRWLPAAGGGHEPDQFSVDMLRVHGAPPAQDQVLLNNPAAKRFGIGRREIEGVVDEEEICIPGLHPPLEPVGDNVRGALAQDGAFDGGGRTITAFEGAAAPGLHRNPGIMALGGGSRKDVRSRQGEIVEIAAAGSAPMRATVSGVQSRYPGKIAVVLQLRQQRREGCFTFSLDAEIRTEIRQRTLRG